MEQENSKKTLLIISIGISMVIVLGLGFFIITTNKIPPSATEVQQKNTESINDMGTEAEKTEGSFGASLYEEVEKTNEDLVEGLPETNPFKEDTEILKEVYVNPFE
jgi:hypothetical protein